MDVSGEVRAFELKSEQLRSAVARETRAALETRTAIAREMLKLDARKVSFEAICRKIRSERTSGDPVRVVSQSVAEKSKTAESRRKEIAELETRIFSLSERRTKQLATVSGLQKQRDAIEQIVSSLRSKLKMAKENAIMDEVNDLFGVVAKKKAEGCEPCGSAPEISDVEDAAWADRSWSEVPRADLTGDPVHRMEQTQVGDPSRFDVTTAEQATRPWSGDGGGGRRSVADQHQDCDSGARSYDGSTASDPRWREAIDSTRRLEGTVEDVSSMVCMEGAKLRLSYTTLAGETLSLSVVQTERGEMSVSVSSEEGRSRTAIKKSEIAEALRKSGLDVRSVTIN